MPSCRPPSHHRLGRAPAARAAAAVSVLVSATLVLSGCTVGGTSGGPAVPASTATTTPAATDPAADDVRARGLAVTVDGRTVATVATAAAVPAPVTNADGSVRLRFAQRATGGAAAGSATAAPTPTPAGPADVGPLAWVTGPAGSTAAVLEDGSAVISGPDGSFLVGFTAPTPSARFTVVGTPAAVLRIDRVEASSLSTAAPGLVSTWLSGRAVVAAVWGEAEGGRSLEVTPSEWARTGTLAAQQALWSQLVADQPEANSPTMHEQLLCHVLGAAGKSTWHIEPWRPAVDALTMLRTRCNPTAADVATAPAATTPAAG